MVQNKFNKDIKVLYGGSVDPSNVSILNKIDIFNSEEREKGKLFFAIRVIFI